MKQYINQSGQDCMNGFAEFLAALPPALRAEYEAERQAHQALLERNLREAEAEQGAYAGQFIGRK